MSLAPPSWLPRLSSRTVDAVVALVGGVVVLSAELADSAAADRRLLGVLIAAATASLLLFGRRWPFPVLAALVGLAFASPSDEALNFPLLLQLFTIGSAGSLAATIAAGGVGTGTAALNGSGVLSPALYCAVVGGLGLYVAGRRASLEAVSQRAEQLDRERQLLADRAVAEERVRIAQELHDVVAHSVSLIVVQAQALGATVPDERVTEATDGIAELGRQAMAEMHRTLMLLRAGEDEAADRGPQPGLGDLDSLVQRARSAGVRVTLDVEGEPRPLSQTLDLSAYRIIQEALTNVVKHAGRAEATVTLGYRPDALELTIADSGEGVASAAPGDSAGGHGIVGMRERAALFGGTLTAGPRHDHGFEVHGLLPYGDGGAR